MEYGLTGKPIRFAAGMVQRVGGGDGEKCEGSGDSEGIGEALLDE